MIDTLPSEPHSSGPACVGCRHPERDHDGRRDHRARYPRIVAGQPWCHACAAPCDYTAAAYDTALDRVESGGPKPEET